MKKLTLVQTYVEQEDFILALDHFGKVSKKCSQDRLIRLYHANIFAQICKVPTDVLNNVWPSSLRFFPTLLNQHTAVTDFRYCDAAEQTLFESGIAMEALTVEESRFLQNMDLFRVRETLGRLLDLNNTGQVSPVVDICSSSSLPDQDLKEIIARTNRTIFLLKKNEPYGFQSIVDPYLELCEIGHFCWSYESKYVTGAQLDFYRNVLSESHKVGLGPCKLESSEVFGCCP